MAALVSPGPPFGAARRAAPRLTYIAGLVALLWLLPEDGGTVSDVLGGMGGVALLGAAGQCLRPTWVRYVRTGEEPPGWLAAEPVGDWDVVLDAPRSSRPTQATMIVRRATGGDAGPIYDAVVGAPSTVASGLCSSAADRLVAELTAAGASAHKQSGAAGR